MNQTAKSISSQRNYGLDLLRLVSAFYVVALHTTGVGGVIGATDPSSYQNYVCRLIMIFSMTAVNIFGILSGYVGYREGQKTAPFSGFFTIWLTAVFYNLLYIAIFSIFLPGTLTWKDFWTSFFPVTFRLYWYLSVHMVVYFLSPFINKIIYDSSEKVLKQLFVFSLIIVLLEYIGEPFRLAEGYSVFWILLLYLIGGIMKKTGIGSQIPSWVAALFILILNFSLLFLGLEENSKTFFIFDFNFDYDHSYVTPVYAATAILHVILFSRFQFNTVGKKLIHFAAPAAFSVYIVNSNLLFWRIIMQRSSVKEIIGSFAGSSPVGVFGKIMLSSLAFVMVVVIVDFFRQKLFHRLGVRNWPEKAVGLFRKEKTS